MSVFSSSRFVAALETFVSRAEAASAHSRLRRVVSRAWTTVGAGDPAGAIAVGGLVVAVAMAVHILLEVLARRSAFPSRAELVLPACLLVAGAGAVLMRNSLAAAWQNRRAR